MLDKSGAAGEYDSGDSESPNGALLGGRHGRKRRAGSESYRVCRAGESVTTVSGLETLRYGTTTESRVLQESSSGRSRSGISRVSTGRRRLRYDSGNTGRRSGIVKFYGKFLECFTVYSVRSSRYGLRVARAGDQMGLRQEVRREVGHGYGRLRSHDDRNDGPVTVHGSRKLDRQESRFLRIWMMLRSTGRTARSGKVKVTNGMYDGRMLTGMAVRGLRVRRAHGLHGYRKRFTVTVTDKTGQDRRLDDTNTMRAGGRSR